MKMWSSTSILSLFITSALTFSKFVNVAAAATGKDVFKAFPMRNKMMQVSPAIRPFTRRNEDLLDFNLDEECASLEAEYYAEEFGTTCDCSGDMSEIVVACENNCPYCIDGKCARDSVSVTTGFNVDTFEFTFGLEQCLYFDNDSYDGVTACYSMDLEGMTVTIDGEACNNVDSNMDLSGGYYDYGNGGYYDTLLIDCSNLGYSTEIDMVTGENAAGPFEFIFSLMSADDMPEVKDGCDPDVPYSMSESANDSASNILKSSIFSLALFSFGVLVVDIVL